MSTLQLFFWATAFGCLGGVFGDMTYYWILLYTFLALFAAQLIFRDGSNQVEVEITSRPAEAGQFPDMDKYNLTVPDYRVVQTFTPGWAAFRFALTAVPFSVIISVIVYTAFW
jgi:hypothetical protein